MGSGRCLVYAAGTFGHDEQGKAVVTDSAADPMDTIRVAAQARLISAIQLSVDDGV